MPRGSAGLLRSSDHARRGGVRGSDLRGRGVRSRQTGGWPRGAITVWGGGRLQLKPPSNQVAAEVAARAILAMGGTRLAVQIAAHVGGRGETSWETDPTLRLYLRRSDGRLYHRGSIGRVRRFMAKKGWISSVRVMPTHTPDKAKRPSTYGTTSKSIAWKLLGVRNPLTKGEKKEARKEARAAMAPSEYKPRRRTAGVDPALARMVAGLGAPHQVVGVVQQKEIAPKGVSTRQGTTEKVYSADERQRRAEERAVEQRARFAAWSAEHDPDPDP